MRIAVAVPTAALLSSCKRLLKTQPEWLPTSLPPKQQQAQGVSLVLRRFCRSNQKWWKAPRLLELLAQQLLLLKQRAKINRGGAPASRTATAAANAWSVRFVLLAVVPAALSLADVVVVAASAGLVAAVAGGQQARATRRRVDLLVAARVEACRRGAVRRGAHRCLLLVGGAAADALPVVSVTATAALNPRLRCSRKVGPFLEM